MAFAFVYSSIYLLYFVSVINHHLKCFFLFVVKVKGNKEPLSGGLVTLGLIQKSTKLADR